MKCKVCRGPAIAQFPAHNANFCERHFDEFFMRQIEKAIRRYKMLQPGERCLVAVSGGKDSLIVVDVFHRLGYDVEGLHISLGIAENDFAGESLAVCKDFLAERGLTLRVFDVKEAFGITVPEAGRRFPRFCALCGMTKRYLMNAEAWRAGMVLATGHNLDDLSSALLANIFRWDVRYLAKNLPVLPEGDGFARKIKPLALLTEREIATYAAIHSIRVVQARCPYAAEASFPKYKQLINGVEEESPGTKRLFYEGYIKHAGLFEAQARAEYQLQPCAVCGMPTSAPVCSFCKTWRRGQG
ncbi:MAG: ATPase [Bacillota bacterium]